MIIKPNELQAVALAITVNATRYYLNGVLCEQRVDGTVGLVATDGNRAHLINYANGVELSDKFILPAAALPRITDMVKISRAAVGKGMTDGVMVQILHDEGKLTIDVGACDTHDNFAAFYGSFTVDAVDATYPDYHRFMPFTGVGADRSGKPHAINGGFLNDFVKAAKLLSVSKSAAVVFDMDGVNSPVLVQLYNSPQFTGVVMPLKWSNGTKG